jgi:Sec-independent protein secretion pathway component TatC
MSENKEMSFLEHLEELRGRLFKAMLGVVVAVIAVLAFDDFVIERGFSPFCMAVNWP